MSIILSVQFLFSFCHMTSIVFQPLHSLYYFFLSFLHSFFFTTTHFLPIYPASLEFPSWPNLNPPDLRDKKKKKSEESIDFFSYTFYAPTSRKIKKNTKAKKKNKTWEQSKLGWEEEFSRKEQIRTFADHFLPCITFYMYHFLALSFFFQLINYLCAVRKKYNQLHR